MTFTTLHRRLGDPPGPLAPHMVDRAVAQGLRETDGLGWKSELPPLGASQRTAHKISLELDTTRASLRGTGVGLRPKSRVSCPSCKDCCATTINNASSASEWADPMCFRIVRTPRRFSTIWTAVAPDEVLTRRMNGLTSQEYRPPSAPKQAPTTHLPAPTLKNPKHL